MAIHSGTRLGSYEIISLIGAGGMGEVYQAHDTKLGRNVAIKVLPDQLAGEPEQLARFKREAKMLAMLNHPNIATIYGLEERNGTHYLIMELVPGETLADRIRREGPVPVRQALMIATQIAEALEAAHNSEKGIIHRDLKPANVKITPEGRVKVLDFGLAKAFATDADDADPSNALTLTMLPTRHGVIMGTPEYMSPEQARGKPVDKRTDVWAFGCVLYELLTGQRAFHGETFSDTIAALLERDRQWQALPAATPANICDLLRHCLQKDLQRRLRDIADARIQIEDALSPAVVPAAKPAGTGAPAAEILPAQHWWRSKAALMIAVILLAALAGAGWFYRSAGKGDAGQGQAINSLAVLPFVNASGDPNSEYLSDGITESLINSLSQLPHLKVMSRDSAFMYKGKQTDARTVGSALGVRAVLEGHVMQRGDDLEISAELVDARDNSHIWGQQYSRKASDIFALQGDLAKEMTSMLKMRLTGEDEKRMAKSYPVNPDAYQLYLQGRYHWGKQSEPELQKSLEYYQQALAKDQNYALAYAGLSDSYSSLSDWFSSPRQVMPQAKAAAMKALELDESLAEAHTSLAFIKTIYDWDWDGAAREAQRAIELNPNSADAHATYAYYLARVGRKDEFGTEIRRAEDLDPLSARIYTRGGVLGYLLGHQYDRAVEQAQKAIELQPDYFLVHAWLGVTYAQMGRLPEAVAEAEKGASLSASPFVHALLGYTYAAAGEKAKARKIAAELTQTQGRHYVCPYEIGTIYLSLGEKDQAFRLYEKAYEDRSICVPFMKFDPRLDSVQADPRYQDLIRRVGFPQ